ncbi:MAG: hypothetical protein ACTS6H_01610 [Candidatus Hodgkinia cicadicola]
MLTGTKLVGNKFQRMRAKLNLFKERIEMKEKPHEGRHCSSGRRFRLLKVWGYGALGGHSSMANVGEKFNFANERNMLTPSAESEIKFGTKGGRFPS